MPKLIMVCGLPGSGKTTLAHALSKQLKLPLLQKDAVKEQLYDQLGLKTLADSKKIGKVSMDLLYNVAEKHAEKGLDLIIEAPFAFPEDYAFFHKIIEKHEVRFYAIICTIPEKIRKQRFYARPRHPAHHDSERDYNPKDEAIYDLLPEKKLRVATDRPIDELVRLAQRFIEQKSS